MQWYEWGLVGLVAVGAAGVLLLDAKTWMRWVYMVAVGMVLWRHFRVEGVHWQVLPLYVAIGILVVIQFALLGDEEGRPVVKLGAWVALVLCAASVAFAWVLPMFTLPEPTGKYAVGVYDDVLMDRRRAADGVAVGRKDDWRELPMRIWYPAEKKTGYGWARYAKLHELKPLFSYKAEIRTNALWEGRPVAGRFPVILFGPRWGGARVQDTFLAEELASHGYVVVAVDHPGNAALAETSEGVVPSDRAEVVSVGPGSSASGLEAAWARELTIWTADDRFVLDWLGSVAEPGNGFPWGTPGMDLRKVGALGHSFGGAASMALLGVDARVKCAVNLDGWTFGGVEHRTTQPVLFVYEGSALPRRAGSGVEGELDAADNAAVDGTLKRYGGVRAYVAGTQHLDFTDQTLVSPVRRLTFTGPIRGERVRTIVRGMVVRFFDEALKGTGAVPEYPEVTVQRFSAGAAEAVR